MKSGMDTFVSKDTQVYQSYDHLYNDVFRKEYIVVVVEGNDVRTAKLTKAIDRLDQQLQSVNGVEETISSASIIKQINYKMTGRSSIPDNDEDIRAIVEGNPNIFKQSFPDNYHTAIFVKFPGSTTEDKRKEIMLATQEAVKLSDFPPSYNIKITGDPAYNIQMNDEVSSSMLPLLELAAFFMLIVLMLVFGHVRWRWLPLPVVLLGVIYTFGAMGFLGIPLTMVSMAAFPVLIGLGIDYAIQFHNRIEEELHKEGNKPKAIIETIKHTGPAVLTALSMTALGFISLFTSTVPMIQDFGKLLMIGVFMCYLSGLFVGVITISLFDEISEKEFIKKLKGKLIPQKTNADTGNTEKISLKKPKPRFIGDFVGKLTDFTIKNNVIVIGIAAMLCIGGLYADESVGIQTDTQSFVPQDMPALVNLNHLKEFMGGTDELDLIIKVNDNADPNILKWIDKFSEHELQRDHIYSASSIVTLIKQYNGGMIPDTRDEVKDIYEKIPESDKAEYLNGKNMLFLSFNIGNADRDIKAIGVQELRNNVKQDIEWMQAPPGTTVIITGYSVVMNEVISALTSGRVAMTYIGLLLVLGGLIVVYRDWVKALVPIIPMFMVTGWSGLVMTFLKLDYTPMTATLGALILGIGCEYSILMMERYFEEKDNGASPLEAIHNTAASIGAALIASGATVVFGFAALIASPFPIVSDFGLVTVIDILLVLAATFTVFPPLIVFLDSWRDKKRGLSIFNNKKFRGLKSNE
jgi:The (Largely Archaeal Putative) Hydrophobe/Amphiphile Efflux-3 (HAE3) Family